MKLAQQVQYALHLHLKFENMPYVILLVGSWLEHIFLLQAKDIESYSSDPAILALAEQFCTSCSVSVSTVPLQYKPPCFVLF